MEWGRTLELLMRHNKTNRENQFSSVFKSLKINYLGFDLFANANANKSELCMGKYMAIN